MLAISVAVAKCHVCITDNQVCHHKPSIRLDRCDKRHFTYPETRCYQFWSECDPTGPPERLDDAKGGAILCSYRSVILAAIAVQFFLITTSLSAAADWDALLAEAKRVTAERVMRAPNGLPRCFLPSDILKGAEAHVINVADSQEIPDADGDSFQGAITVVVERSEMPMLLYIRSGASNAWKFRIAEDAKLSGIHIVGYSPQYVLELPEGVPLTLRAQLEKS